jgi:hypothetical protein
LGSFSGIGSSGMPGVRLNFFFPSGIPDIYATGDIFFLGTGATSLV